MNRICLLTAFYGLLNLSPLVLCGEEPVRRKEKPIRIQHNRFVGEKEVSNGELCVLDSELMFVSFSENGQRPGGPEAPPLPDYSLHFLWDAPSPATGKGGPFSPPGMLRVKMAPKNAVVDRQGTFPMEFVEKNGWYITADYSSDPPRVILTEKPTKGSQWLLVEPFGSRKFIKNADTSGEAVWLTMEAQGKTYRGGIARRPILSNEKKDHFWIGDANSGK